MADNSVYQGASIPAGGAADQVLTKDTGADFDYSWQDPGNVFGSEFNAFEDLPESVTTNSTYTQLTRFTTPSLPAGEYFVSWSADAGAKTNKKTAHRLQQDDSNTLRETNWKADEGNLGLGNTYFSFAGSAVLSLSGVHTFDFDAQTESGDEAYFNQVRLTLWRVS